MGSPPHLLRDRFPDRLAVRQLALGRSASPLTRSPMPLAFVAPRRISYPKTAGLHMTAPAPDAPADLARSEVGHHLHRHGGGVHADPRHQRHQRHPPAPAGSLSAGLDEVSWVITSYLAANAVVIPATGWLAGLFGRKNFFLICTTLFVVELLPLRRRPRPDHADHRPHLPGPRRRADHPALAGHPLGDLPLPPARPRHGGVGHRLHPRARSWARPSAAIWPTSGRGAGSSTSTCPSASLGFLLASAFLFDPPYQRRAARIDWWGLGLMVAGFGCLQLVLDRGRARGLVRLVDHRGHDPHRRVRARRLPDPRADRPAIPSWTSPSSPTATSPPASP